MPASCRNNLPAISLDWRFITARPIGHAPDLGGTEQAVLNLRAALEARGHRMAVEAAGAGATVAINDARLLPPGAARPVVWFHNEVSMWREWRRGRLPALFGHRPLAVFCGAGQMRHASALLPFRARATLPHGLPAAILAAASAEAPPPPHALFISQAYRGLAKVIALWRRQVAPSCTSARLTTYIAPADLQHFLAMASGTPSIAIMPRVANSAMPALLASARLVFAPGHRAETFCLAAAEAIAMGVPVITRGTGALAERVQHGRTGFICRNDAEMAFYARALLTDDALWLRMQAHGLATRTNAGWDPVAAAWEDIIATTFS